ncbi:hypothetical protein EVAR_51054_1 [Eumeta japonica]|uniref:Uncharacterized protein n=1 Tax=Eumeta variegata TaxID=151549 RepID=A0A4C1ZA46_EUMVA|nr:hypothetical protein EVAR_51054_1 [Eumeta japonica]
MNDALNASKKAQYEQCGELQRLCEILKTVLKKTTARRWKLPAALLSAAPLILSSRHSIPRAPFRYQDVTVRRGVRRPCNEAKRAEYLNYDARMRLAMRPPLATGAETIEKNLKND